MSEEVDDGIKRKPAKDNPWYQFLLETIELDKEFEESFGIHWFVGIYLLQNELNGFKRLELRQINDALPDGHEFKNIDVLKAPFFIGKQTKLKEIHDNLLQKGTFITLDNMLNKYGISKKASGHEIKEIDFSGLMFEDNIDFSELIFPMNVSFVGTKFATTANFADAIFCDKANFDWAVFSNGADFYRAKFAGETHLSRINFYQNMYQTSFTEATFSGLTIIRETKFHGHTYFTKTIFSNWAVFIDTQFLHFVEFKSATFFDDVDFEKTIFSTRADFEKTTFSGKMIFKNATFYDSISFDNVKIRGRTDFTNAEFKKYAPSFHSADFHPDALWDKVKWPPTENCIKDELYEKYRERIIDNQNAYETLAYHMEGLDKYHDQHFFFRHETRCRQSLAGVLAKCFYWLYEKLANYGYSIERAFSWWLGHIVVGMIAIFILSLINSWLKLWKDGAWETIKSALCSIPVSFANAHGFLPFHNAPLKKCYASFMESDVFNAIWVFQTIVGIPLLFLVLLTLRIRYRLK